MSTTESNIADQYRPTGCLPEKSEILKATGLRQFIEKIKVGDKMMCTSGKPATVTGIVSIETDQAYQITPQHGKAYIVNDSHRLVLMNKVTRETALISPSSWLEIRGSAKNQWGLFKYAIREFENPSIRFPVQPYKMGNEYYGNFKTSIMPEDDPDDDIIVGSTTLPSLSMYQTASIRNRLEFLAGVMDAGGIRTATGYIFDTWYPALAETLVQICWSVGIRAELPTSPSGFSHVIIDDTTIPIPSRKYQTNYDWSKVESNIPIYHSWTEFTVEKMYTSPIKFYGLCTDSGGFLVAGDYTCIDYCEPLQTPRHGYTV